MSPYYPEPFAPNTTCDWAISVGEDHGLRLIFIDIDLPGTYRMCCVIEESEVVKRQEEILQ